MMKKKNELAMIWLGDMMWNEEKIKLEDYILNLANIDVLKNEKIIAATSTLDDLINGILSNPIPLSNPYKKEISPKTKS